MTRQWADEASAFTRAFAGAAVFGIPLVFTMEMWWIGKTLSILDLTVIIALAFFTNFGLARVAGFREEMSLSISIDESIDAIAVGIVTAAILLISMNQLRLSDGVNQGLGTIILLALPLSLGASVARQVFSGREGREGDDVSDLSAVQGVLADVGATAIGGVFIGMSIAPTEEVKMIAAGLAEWHVFMLIGISLLLSYIIVFASGFDEASPPGPFQHPLSETMLSYVVALFVAFGMLMLFNRVTLDDPFSEIVRQTVVLAVPASVGGAGGRLVV